MLRRIKSGFPELKNSFNYSLDRHGVTVSLLDEGHRGTAYLDWDKEVGLEGERRYATWTRRWSTVRQPPR